MLSLPPPLEISLPYNILYGDCPPPLKFAAMCLPPLERNPEIYPATITGWPARLLLLGLDSQQLPSLLIDLLISGSALVQFCLLSTQK